MVALSLDELLGITPEENKALDNWRVENKKKEATNGSRPRDNVPVRRPERKRVAVAVAVEDEDLPRPKRPKNGVACRRLS
jgi:hypothetical protein